jgi:hypothetical protein
MLSCFEDVRLIRIDGTYRLIRDLGPVKGGKRRRHRCEAVRPNGPALLPPLYSGKRGIRVVSPTATQRVFPTPKISNVQGPVRRSQLVQV